MSQIADRIIPSHYRELKLSKGQRAAAHRLAEARKLARGSYEVFVPKTSRARLGSDYRVRPILVRPTISEPDE